MGSNVTRWQDHSWQKRIATGLATYLNPIDYIYSLNRWSFITNSYMVPKKTKFNGIKCNQSE